MNYMSLSLSSLPDANARVDALRTDRSFHVESPAGAGKTSLLTARFIHLLTVVDHPHEILALTFTNKAAGEMKERIGSVLRLAGKDGPPGSPWLAGLLPAAKKALQRHAKHSYLLQAPDGLRIMTFHSFCLFLARQAPLESGIPFEASVAPDEDQAELLAEAVRNLHRELFAGSGHDPLRQALERRLLHLNNNWEALEAELKDLLGKRDLLNDLAREVRANAGKENLAEILAERTGILVSHRLSSVRQRFIQTGLGRNWPEMHAFLTGRQLQMTAPVPSTIPDSSWESLSSWQAIAGFCLTKSGSPRKQFTAANGFPKGFRETAWGEMIRNLSVDLSSALHSVRDLPSIDEAATDVDALFDLILLIAKAIQVYSEVCRKRRAMDYAELELAALRALGELTDLQFILDRAFRHILIDEFQDTSRNQWELLQRLCTGWVPGDGRTLFVVGDPKQSIYGFRKADVSIFTEAKTGLPLSGHGRLEFHPVRLSTNFRSAPALIDFYNRFFGEAVMIKPDLEVDEVPYENALPAPGKASDSRITLSVFSKDAELPEAGRTNEASWLACRIKETLHTHPDRSIGILLPARTHLPAYLKALSEFGLQVRVQEGIRLKERPEVLDLLALTYALVRPHDDLSWAALLRSAWCWVGIDALYGIARQGPPDWMTKIGAFQQQVTAPQELKRLWTALESHAPRVGRESLDLIVADIWEEADGPAAVSARFGPAAVENCRSFLKILTQSEKGIPEETLAGLERCLERAYAPPDPLTSRSPVELMTIHRAKGLEFDIVFLPFLDWNPLGGGNREAPPYLLERLPEREGEYLIAVRPDKRLAEDDKVYQLLRDIRKRRALGEAKRLFYVAATRARRELHMSGLVKPIADCGLRIADTKEKNKNNAECGVHSADLKGSTAAPGCGFGMTDLGNETAEKSYSATPNSFLHYLLTSGIRNGIEFYEDPSLPEKGVEPCISALDEIPEPLPFRPEKLPYHVVSPSMLRAEESPRDFGESAPNRIADCEEKNDNSAECGVQGAEYGGENNAGPERIDDALAKGTVIHRLLECLADGKDLPPEKTVGVSLVAEGMSSETAAVQAGGILAEVEACRAEEFCAFVLDSGHPFSATEWAIEDYPEAGVVRSGKIDRVVYDGDQWWIVDYKTSAFPPGGEAEDFMKAEAAGYRSQLCAYREMLVRARQVDYEKVRMVLYFTSIQRAYERAE
ncbi:MAG: UvrD-helicase domain-containing protein [Pseudomonadota bacterium]